MTTKQVRTSAQEIVEALFSIFIGILIIFTMVATINLFMPVTYDGTFDFNPNPPDRSMEHLTRGGVILILSVILMFSSLHIPFKAKVLANGILLGGVFSTIYAVAEFQSATVNYRIMAFFLTLLALVTALAFGWVKFTKRQDGVEMGVPATGEAMAVGARQAQASHSVSAARLHGEAATTPEEVTEASVRSTELRLRVVEGKLRSLAEVLLEDLVERSMEAKEEDEKDKVVVAAREDQSDDNVSIRQAILDPGDKEVDEPALTERERMNAADDGNESHQIGKAQGDHEQVRVQDQDRHDRQEWENEGGVVGSTRYMNNADAVDQEPKSPTDPHPMPDKS